MSRKILFLSPKLFAVWIIGIILYFFLWLTVGLTALKGNITDVLKVSSVLAAMLTPFFYLFLLVAENQREKITKRKAYEAAEREGCLWMFRVLELESELISVHLGRKGNHVFSDLETLQLELLHNENEFNSDKNLKNFTFEKFDNEAQSLKRHLRKRMPDLEAHSFTERFLADIEKARLIAPEPYFWIYSIDPNSVLFITREQYLEILDNGHVEAMARSMMTTGLEAKD